jgi:hypothetical protein
MQLPLTQVGEVLFHSINTDRERFKQDMVLPKKKTVSTAIFSRKLKGTTDAFGMQLAVDQLFYSLSG